MNADELISISIIHVEEVYAEQLEDAKNISASFLYPKTSQGGLEWNQYRIRRH